MYEATFLGLLRKKDMKTTFLNPTNPIHDSHFCSGSHSGSVFNKVDVLWGGALHSRDFFKHTQ
ncbi:hypothetical protein SAMN05660226_02014 [Parapedobacter luteus]|uniref:Uncharacterized protein n=1 Tax=Parapedobacter luteus TaxID=623280 RepID=A0A1T5CAZ4_9SPHI|nr:hypothetical protein SAMN05660226_02014 [Parapedobacter luteus]